VSAGEASVAGAAAHAPATQVFGADEQTAVGVDVLRWVQLAQLVLREERVPPAAEVSVVFVGEDAIADLNRRFLGGDGPTDVLAFPIDDDPLPSGRHPDEGGRGPGASDEVDEPPIVLGDVLVCPAVAARQAPEHGQSVEDELALLVVHGVLHLLDYDHAEPDEAARMQGRERELLARFAAIERRAASPGEPGEPGERTQADGHE
jgi:probable rRNA maturation factor